MGGKINPNEEAITRDVNWIVCFGGKKGFKTGYSTFFL